MAAKSNQANPASRVSTTGKYVQDATQQMATASLSYTRAKPTTSRNGSPAYRSSAAQVREQLPRQLRSKALQRIARHEGLGHELTVKARRDFAALLE